MATFPFAISARGTERLVPPQFIRASEPKRDDPSFAAMCGLYSRERSLYPPQFFAAVGLRQLVFCERMSFDGQSRRASPTAIQTASGTLWRHRCTL